MKVKFNTNIGGAESIKWALNYIWREEKQKLLGIISLTFIKSLIPAGLALVGRKLINTFVILLEAGAKEIHLLYPWLLISFLLTLLDAGISEVKSFSAKRLGDELQLKLMSDLLNKVSLFELTFFEDSSKQDLLNYVRGNSIKQLNLLILNSLSAVSLLLQGLSLSIILIYIEPLLSLLIPCIIIPYFYSQWRLANLNSQVIFSQKTERRWSGYFLNLLTKSKWVKEIKILNLSPFLIRQLSSLLTHFKEENRKLYLSHLNSTLLFIVSSTIGIYLLFIRISEKVIAGLLTVGDVTIYLGSTVKLRSILQNLITTAKTTREQINLISDLKYFLELPVSNKPKYLKQKKDFVKKSPQTIHFENVSFSYPNTEEEVLSNLSFQINPGEKLAIVGVNGAGKTTLVKLLSGLYEPTKGRILYDKLSLKEYSKKAWQEQISFVFQKCCRFEANVIDNIAYGDWERLYQAANKQEQIKHIAKQTNINGLIKALPQGYQTQIGRKFGSYDLSIGQWQKLAIARAIAKAESTLLILDEPTASMDAQSEFQFLQQISRLSINKSVILISHRFSTLSLADRIIVLEKGKIIEEGTHESLLTIGGHYANLYQLQNADILNQNNE